MQAPPLCLIYYYPTGGIGGIGLANKRLRSATISAFFPLCHPSLLYQTSCSNLPDDRPPTFYRTERRHDLGSQKWPDRGARYPLRTAEASRLLLRTVYPPVRRRNHREDSCIILKNMKLVGFILNWFRVLFCSSN